MNNRFNKNELIKLYNKFNSIKDIAIYLNIKYNTLHYYFKKYRIGNYSCRGTALTKEELIELYTKFGSITKVAAELSYSYATIRSWYEYYNISVAKSNMNIYHELRSTPMSKQQLSVLIGSMLGDGCLRKSSKCKNALLEISHCEKQLPYLRWKHGLLRPFSRPIKIHETEGKKIICGREVNNSNFYRFYTIVHPDITELFIAYYRKGLKGVNTSLINKTDLIAMGVWFSDDGTIQRDKKGVPKMCNICTNSFTYKEHLVLVEIVKKFFNGTIKIVKRNVEYNGNREYFMIQMTKKKHVCDFLDLIKLVLPECIYYKLS
jgi:hypothetical protein